MQALDSKISGVFQIVRSPVGDQRGYLSRTFDVCDMPKFGMTENIVQSSVCFTSLKGTVRGLHFQKAPYQEDKIVQCMVGRIYDVVVDLRAESPTFCCWEAFELTGEGSVQLYIPKGVAHGYQALENNVLVYYMMTQKYSAEHASGVRWNDSDIGIKWPLPVSVMSDKDLSLPKVSELIC